MSDFFTKIKEGVDKGTNKIRVKSSTLFESNKIRNKIANLNRTKQDLLLELGVKVYKLKENNAFDLEQCTDLFERLDDIDTSIANKEDELKELLIKQEQQLNADRCECGALLDNNVNFCCACGKKVTNADDDIQGNIEEDTLKQKYKDSTEEEIVIDMFEEE